MARNRFFIISGILIFVLTFSVYFDTLGAFFNGHDCFWILRMKGESFVGIFREIISRGHAMFLTPLANLFWKLDYLIWHLNPFGYHLTNTTIHALNSLLVVILTFLLTKNKLLSLFAGILFAIHPIHSEAVIGLVARYYLLCTFFYLLSLVTFITYSSSAKKPYLYLISIISYVLALLSKEMGVTLPIILVLWALIYKHRQRLRFYIPYLTLTSIYIIWRFIYMGGMDGYRDFERKPLYFQFHLVPFLKRMLYNIPLSLILPINREAISHQIQTQFAFLFFISVAIALYFNWRYMNKTLLLFGLSFTAVSLAPGYNIVWVGSDLGFSRALYLPAIGFCIVIASLFLVEGNIRSNLKKLNLFLITIFCLAYIFILHKNNQPWNMAGRITGQIPKIARDYTRRFSSGIKLYFLIPSGVNGAPVYGYGEYISKTIAPLILPLKPEDMAVINEVKRGPLHPDPFYDFDLRKRDFASGLGKQTFFFKWNETSGLLEDVSLSIKSKLNNPKQDTVLPKTYRLTGKPQKQFIISDIHIPVVSIGAIELRMRVKSLRTPKTQLEITWLSNHDTKWKRWEFKKHINFLIKIDGEFHTYKIPFYLFNPDWLGQVYLEGLRFEGDRSLYSAAAGESYKLEIEYVKLLPYES